MVSINYSIFLKIFSRFSLHITHACLYNNIFVHLFQMKELEKKIIAECKDDVRVVACRFPLPNIEPEAEIGTGVDTVWLYKIPKMWFRILLIYNMNFKYLCLSAINDTAMFWILSPLYWTRYGSLRNVVNCYIHVIWIRKVSVYTLLQDNSTQISVWVWQSFDE